MAQIFFSFTEADYPVVSHLASYLAHEGYSSWNYKDNGVPGVNYLEQIEEELAATKVVIVIVSRQTLSSDQVYHELHTAHERSIPYLPVLVGLSYKDLQATGKKLEMYVRRNTSIQIGPNVQTIFESIKAGLMRFGVVADHAVSSEPYTFPQHEQLASAPSSQKFELRPSRKSEKKSASHIWSGVIGAVALSGLVFLLTQSSGEKPQSANASPGHLSSCGNRHEYSTNHA